MIIERTISGMMGKGSVNHNTRKFKAENIDKERSKFNIQYINDNLKEVYHELFHESMIHYNAKQKRKDRVIDNYYEKIRISKQEKLFYEVVFQIGNKKDMNTKSEDGELAKHILDEFMQCFQERNSNLRVFSAHLHMDEETPHLHIDFVPFTSNSKRGMETRVSLKQALAQQGFIGGTKKETEWNQWIENEKKELAKSMECYGVKWKKLGTHNKHLSILNYEKQERTNEINQLEYKINNAQQDLLSVNELEQEKQKNLIVLDNKTAKLQYEIQSLISEKSIIERNIHVYDYNPEWQLPEPSAFSGIKSYTENKIIPFIAKLKQVIKDLTIQYIQISESLKKTLKQLDILKEQSYNMTEKYLDIIQENEILRNSINDYHMVKLAIGEEKVNDILVKVKKMEQTEQNKKDKEYLRGRGWI